MSTTSTVRSKYGADAIRYAIKGKGKSSDKKRNIYVTSKYMSSRISYSKQMAQDWKRGRSNQTCQALRITQSFSKKELNPKNPKDILKANFIGQAFVSEHYPDRKALICTQIDGKNGCIHNHIIVCAVSMRYHIGLTKEQCNNKCVAEWTREITSRYTDVDYGSGNHYDNISAAENALLIKDGYSYKNDIRQRVASVMNEAVSEEDFFNKLAANGVSVAKRTKAKEYTERSKTRNDYYLYELTDISNFPKARKLPDYKLAIRSYKLGTAYGPMALEEHLQNLAVIGIKESGSDDAIIDNGIDTIPEIKLSAKVDTKESNAEIVATKPTNDVEDTERNIREYMLHKRMNEADSEEEETENNSPYSIPATKEITATAKSVTNGIETEGKDVKAVSNSKSANGTAPVSNKSAKPNGTGKQGTEPPVKNKNEANSNNANNKANKAALLNYAAKKGNPTDQKDDDDCHFDKE